jgi:hypothetical protein
MHGDGFIHPSSYVGEHSNIFTLNKIKSISSAMCRSFPYGARRSSSFALPAS